MTTPPPKTPPPPMLPHLAAAVLVLPAGVLAAVWLSNLPLAMQVLVSTPVVAFAVAIVGQQLALRRAGRGE
jgi:hypothetical protein